MMTKLQNYKCSLCGLHYNDKELAEKCRDWCSQHDSCSYIIAKNSIESVKIRGKSMKWGNGHEKI